MKCYEKYKLEFICPEADLVFIFDDDGDFVGRYKATDGRTYHNTASLLTPCGLLDLKKIRYVTGRATCGLDETETEEFQIEVLAKIRETRKKLLLMQRKPTRMALIKAILTGCIG